jgi:Na+/H+ antiporter NhaD/arsenite permease-like protein
MAQDESKFPKDKKLLKKSVIGLLGVIFMFGFHGARHIEVSVIALGGAAVLFVITRVNPEKYCARWTGQPLCFLQDYSLW